MRICLARLRAVFSALASIALALLCATSAIGATASVVSDDATYVAASGETNDVSVVVIQGRFRITDPGAVITAGAGCTSVSAHVVTCTRGEFRDIIVMVKDEADSVALGPWQTMNGRVYGGGGDDLLKGAGWTNGGFGDDTLLGSGNADSLFGGPGNDILRSRDGSSSVSLWGGRGNDTLFGSPVEDVIEGGSGRDDVEAGAGPDAVFGGLGADRLHGNRGGDFIAGGGGSDRIMGGPSNDLLKGGWGNDTISGGDGHEDQLRGGPENDTLLARDGLRDMVFGYLGFDRARVDIGLDLVHGVEQRL